MGRVALGHGLDLFVGGSGELHHALPDGIEAFVLAGGKGAEIGGDKKAIRPKSTGDLAKKIDALGTVGQKLGNKDGSGGVAGEVFGDLVNEGGVKLTAVEDTGLSGVVAAGLKHGDGGIDRDELPVGKGTGESEEFSSGANSDTEDAGVGREITKNQTHLEVEAVAKRGEGFPLSVVAGCVAGVEGVE